MRTTTPILVTLLLAAPLIAQEDRAAGLFTAARQLPLVAQTAQLQVTSDEAEVVLEQVFHNDGPDEAQADFRLHLPEGATVVGFGFFDGSRFLAAELKERAAARAAHHRAAAEHRTTGLLERSGSVHVFSVYPVAAGERKRVRVTVRLPVLSERGRSSVRLPLDLFLGHRAVTTAVIAHVATPEPLLDLGVDGADAVRIAHERQRATVAFAAAGAVEVWWAQESPPLLASALAAPLAEGDLALQVRLALNDASEWARPPRSVHVLVDGSASMRRRRGEVAAVLRRLAVRSPAPVQLHRVGTTWDDLGPLQGDPEEIAAHLLDPALADHGSSWSAFAAAAAALGCASDGVRCLAVTDPQLPGLEPDPGGGLGLLLLADGDERDHYRPRLGPHPPVFQHDAEPVARLDALADRAVLPVLALTSLRQAGVDVELAGAPDTTAAEGALLRLAARVPTAAPLELCVAIDGQPACLDLPVDRVDPDGGLGRTVRRALYREVLAEWMAEWTRTNDAGLRQRIVELSLREGIPTVFTALQVDDPRLSLAAFKPGDPILTVAAEPGLVEVLASYPFGRHAALAAMPDGGFSDRFLVPRGWPDGGYRIRVFKRFADAGVEESAAWYRLDSDGPDALLTADPLAGVLRIATGAATADVAAVQIHTSDQRLLALEPAGGTWAVPLADLSPAFTVVLRDRAANRTVIPCRLGDGGLEVLDREAAGSSAAPPPPTAWPSLSGGDGALRLEGGAVVLTHDGRTWSFDRAGAGLRSLELTAVLVRPDGVLLGTAEGDLVALSGCGDAGACTARRLGTRWAGHPVTGLAALGDEVLVGVLGRGLLRFRRGRLEASPLDLGTRWITGVAGDGHQAWIATSDRGLWRAVGGRAYRTRLEARHISALGFAAGRLLVTAGADTWLRRGRDRFEPAGPAAAVRPRAGDGGITAGVVHAGRLVAGTFDGGLIEHDGTTWRRVDVGLDPAQGRVNALASFAGALWIGSEGGLVRLTGGAPEVVLDAAVHALAGAPEGLAVATADGLWVVRADGRRQRWDLQEGPHRRTFAAVAWWRGGLVAGTLDGLWRFLDVGVAQPIGAAAGRAVGSVTALLPDGDRVLVGTYDEGVLAFDGWRLRPVPGLEHWWVPPGGLAHAGGAVWVGGLGQSPARLAPDGTATILDVPARDTNAAVEDPDGAVWLLTSTGPLRVD